jgi:hypothetical protein
MVRKKKKHHNIKEFTGKPKEENGMFEYISKGKNKRMVAILKMNLKQQRESINFVKNLEFLYKILKSVQYQINNIR